MMTSQIKEPSISTIMSIPDGKILDFFDKAICKRYARGVCQTKYRKGSCSSV